MTIIEAIKSGLPLRRAGKTTWARNSLLVNTCGGGWIAPEYLLASFQLTQEDILAVDWETQEKKVELTRSDIEAAYCRVPVFAREKPFLDLFLRELGFND